MKCEKKKYFLKSKGVVEASNGNTLREAVKRLGFSLLSILCYEMYGALEDNVR
jgi:hypothetical protein